MSERDILLKLMERNMENTVVIRDLGKFMIERGYKLDESLFSLPFFDDEVKSYQMQLEFQVKNKISGAIEGHYSVFCSDTDLTIKYFSVGDRWHAFSSMKIDMLSDEWLEYLAKEKGEDYIFMIIERLKADIGKNRKLENKNRQLALAFSNATDGSSSSNEYMDAAKKCQNAQSNIKRDREKIKKLESFLECVSQTFAHG